MLFRKKKFAVITSSGVVIPENEYLAMRNDVLKSYLKTTVLFAGIFAVGAVAYVAVKQRTSDLELESSTK